MIGKYYRTRRRSDAFVGRDKRAPTEIVVNRTRRRGLAAATCVLDREPTTFPEGWRGNNLIIIVR